MTQVYLAGAIENVPLEFAQGWRQLATQRLATVGITTINPLDIEQPQDFDYGDMEAVRDMVLAEKIAIRESDVLLVNKEQMGIGTSMEMMCAYLEGVEYIITYGEVKPHPWIMMHEDLKFETLTGALNWIMKEYGNGS